VCLARLIQLFDPGLLRRNKDICHGLFQLPIDIHPRRKVIVATIETRNGQSKCCFGALL
jgi:hypothetical protein